MWLVVAMSSAMAQRISAPVQLKGSTREKGSSVTLPFVNSSGLRLRDFPSTGEGRILTVLNEGQRLEISAVTSWQDRIGDSVSPWYHVSVRDETGLVGWVYGEYVSFEPGYPLDSQSVRLVSRQQMNRPLLVLQLFRRLLGSDTRQVSTAWLRGLSQATAAQPSPGFATDYSLRDYKTSFGDLAIRFNPRDKRQLVLSLSLDRPSHGMLITVGEPISRVQEVLGSDYYRQGQSLYYRGIPGVETYGITVHTENGVVSAINASALVE